MKSIELRPSDGPPKPGVALRFAISGHRELTEGASTRIARDLERLFKDTRAIVEDIRSTHHTIFSHAKAQLSIISPLAEGADRLAASAALKLGFALNCPLPFVRELYEDDFSGEDSVAAFRDLLARASNIFEFSEPRGENGARAYEAVGVLTLRQCDILIAIWNGDVAAGRGGTGDIVARALNSNVPVIWINSENDVCLKHLKQDRMSVPNPMEISSEELSDTSLRALLNNVLLPPADPRTKARRPPSRRINDYWRERQKSFNLAVGYSLLQTLFLFRVPRIRDIRVENYLSSAREQWHGYWHLIPAVSGSSLNKLATVLLPAFAWADGLASYYVRRYRSSYVLSFVFSALAVACSLLGLWPAASPVVLSAVELVFTMAVVAIVSAGLGQSWHDRWIDYRHLAELLRQMRVLFLTGSCAIEMRDNSHADDSRRDSGAAWVEWYYRAIIRDLGMAGVLANHDYATAVGHLVQKTELSEQMKYHRETEESSHKLDHRLDWAGIVLFGASALVCAIFLAGGLFHQNLGAYENWERFVTAFLPSLGAAIYGIRVQGEFGRVSRRARRIREQLFEISEAMTKGLEEDKLTISSVSFLTEKAAYNMALDVTDWRFVFREKPLTLPA